MWNYIIMTKRDRWGTLSKVRVGLTPPLAREERVEQVCHIWSRVFTTPRGQNRLMGIKLNPRWIGGSFLSLSLSFFLAQFSSRLMPTGITCICHHFGRKLRSVDELEKSCVAAVHRKTVKCSGQNWRALLHPWLSTRLDVLVIGSIRYRVTSEEICIYWVSQL